MFFVLQFLGEEVRESANTSSSNGTCTRQRETAKTSEGGLDASFLGKMSVIDQTSSRKTMEMFEFVLHHSVSSYVSRANYNRAYIPN